jgi:5-methylcytosine-specific restriction endonuclease McrA
MSRYSSMLRDPRWQRKRLKIMESDKWKCSKCGSTKSELNVHHLRYE